jgi:hypothetical protein
MVLYSNLSRVLLGILLDFLLDFLFIEVLFKNHEDLSRIPLGLSRIPLDLSKILLEVLFMVPFNIPWGPSNAPWDLDINPSLLYNPSTTPSAARSIHWVHSWYCNLTA